MEQKIWNIWETRGQGKNSRRDFIRKLAVVTGSTAAALTLMPVLENNQLTAAEKKQEGAKISGQPVFSQMTGKKID